MRIKKTSATTPIQAQVLNTNSVSQVDTYSCDYINTHKSEYSSDEQIVGVWTDNKPIYRKNFSYGTIGTGTSTTIGAVNNVDTVINMTGAIYDDGIWFAIPRVHQAQIIYQTQIYLNGTNLIVSNGTSAHIEKIVVSVEYTKTTD